MGSSYDFTPFLKAKTVQETQRPFGRPQIIPIPATLIVSPLAPDISPRTVHDLKEYLLGNNAGRKPRGRLGGEELWKTWRRAWDIWNNHYIEGRESPVWIRAEYERIRKEMVAERDERRREQYLRRLRRNARSRATRLAPKIIFAKERPAPTAPGKIFKKTGRSKIEIGEAMVKRPNPGRLQEMKKGETRELYGQQLVPMEIVQMKRTVSKDGAPVKGWAQVTSSRKSGEQVPHKDETRTLASTATEVETTYMARQPMKPTRVFESGDYQNTGGFKLLTYEELTKLRHANGTQPRAQETTRNDLVQDLESWVPVTESSFTNETTVVDQDGKFLTLTFRDEKIEVLEKHYEWKEVYDDGNLDEDTDANHGMADSLTDKDAVGPASDDDNDDDDHEPIISIPAPHRVIYGQNESGGFQPMKDFPEYAPPIPDDDEDDQEWMDAIDNTVWRPRLSGEKQLRIDIDESFDEFGKTALEIFGGVDCGRSPYPVHHP